jgi:hypothetical protein
LPLSANFSVNASTDVIAHEVGYGDTVDLELQSITDARIILWTIGDPDAEGSTAGTSHEDIVAPTITYSGAPSGHTASFTMVADPGDGEGRSVTVKCKVTNAAGATAVAYRIVGVPNAAGIIPICVDEALYRSETMGWVGPINTALAGTQIGNVRNYGATGDGVTDDTAAIQAAIDACYAAGGGIVYLPPGQYVLGLSTLADELYNFGDAVDVSVSCSLVLRDGVTLRGAGVGVTVLLPDEANDCIAIADGNNACVENLEIDGGFTTGNGHGIIQYLSADDDDTTIDNLTVRNVYVHDVGSYGIAFENGVFTNCLMENVRVYNTGADGIDVKNRSTGTDSKGIHLSNIYVDTFGQRTGQDGSAGVDMRGIVTATGIQVVGVGRSGVSQAGIRFRTLEAAGGDNWARRSSLTGFYVRAADPSFSVDGVTVGSSDATLTGGTIEDCDEGVVVEGSAEGAAEHVTISAVTVINADTRAFFTATSGDHAKFIGCTAVDSLLGFRLEGDNNILVACAADNCTTAQTSGTAAGNSLIRIGCNFGGDMLSTRYVTAGRVALTAAGSSTDIDLALEPKGAGTLRVGTHSAIASETVTGYITIKDSSGNSRKLAVVS